MADISTLFGSMVFNEAIMQQRLPHETYKALCKTIKDGKRLDPQVANIVANAMKDWAIEKGVTHYTHWFQPMTGITAEKHDSFIAPISRGHVIMEFSGKELVRGESDASSFPSGGLRATFEARGYTAWDPTSYAFIKDGVLCIPTAFCSYGGEALDKKTPLLRSMEALSRQALRVLKLFGHTNVTRVNSTAGPEQEYFLVDKALFDQRKDLIFTGRTLFGAKPPKGQELDDHYFGAIKPRVQAFMTELNEELWKLGVLAKTEHNEAAPSQHEMAPIFTLTNIAADHNQLTMEMMKRVAGRHGLVCLLHEKPFAGVAGSGKHNNWSMATNTGMNLLEPGETPYENAQFLLFLTAVIKAVDDYQDLLRMSVASAGNDHRLGAGEAPPAIISMFLGDELTAVLEALESDTAYEGPEKKEMAIGVHVMPKFPKDTTDRNRTSPFAFTGNKFEFRMVGSSASISGPNVIINTIVAESLRQFANKLETAQDFQKELHDLIASEIKAHKRIIFNGNNYSEEWVKEAERRGLLNMVSSVESLPCYTAPKNLELFATHRILSAAEAHSRCEIKLEGYVKLIRIEAATMLDMARQDILPAVLSYAQNLAESLLSKREALPGLPLRAEEGMLTRISKLADDLYEKINTLAEAIQNLDLQAEAFRQANYCHDVILSAMSELRIVADELETLTAKEYWPYPTYADLLFSV